ncbi:MAG TPA: DUF4265 domain-containing protein, partial [Pyrinomonadaceae bacterium]|nr:DUF4265 domain-containing protein [Pyrinomonadaceae bacterium]
MSDDAAEPNARVLFRIERVDGTADVETPWAFDLGDDIYRLDECLFFAYSVSWNDEVYAPYDAKEKFPVFRRVHKKSGNRSIRLILDPPYEPGNSTDQLLERLLNMNCSYEGATKRLFAITIPPEIELSSIVEFLVEQEVEWEHSDPRY